VATRFDSFDGALAWLDAHIDYERTAPTRRLLPSLVGMEQALGLLGHPERDYQAIHITGTNGKGSTTAMITSLLVELGLSVGTYTSPNLHEVNERIAWNGEAIPDDDFCDVLFRLALIEDELAEPLTRFELLTVAAFAYFADCAIDVAVVEVGLGGTWDSTNVIDGVVSVLTNVSLDHVQVLGSTVEEIAADKSGIIKPGSVAILGDDNPSVRAIAQARCDEVGASGLWVVGQEFSASNNRLAFGGRVVDLQVPGMAFDDVMVPLHGPHQGRNASVALAAVTAFLGRAPSSDVVEAGFGAATILGRMEVLGHLPLVIVDGAHNAAGVRALCEALIEGFSVEGRSVAVIGMLEGRDPSDLMAPFVDAGITSVVCVEPDTPRAMDAGLIVKAAIELGLEATPAATIDAGIEQGLDQVGENGLLLATGSLYVIGHARATLRRILADR
jgi:dihydrofolate synthase / folylpolyglutamate synthase